VSLLEESPGSAAVAVPRQAHRPVSKLSGTRQTSDGKGGSLFARRGGHHRNLPTARCMTSVRTGSKSSCNDGSPLHDSGARRPHRAARASRWNASPGSPGLKKNRPESDGSVREGVMPEGHRSGCRFNGNPAAPAEAGGALRRHRTAHCRFRGKLSVADIIWRQLLTQNGRTRWGRRSPERTPPAR
jgi:hypothetical protein